jgi:hypothetical protein
MRARMAQAARMPYFADDDEVYRYIGGIFREAADHPVVGPKLKAADITLQMHYADPGATLTVKFTDPLEVLEGDVDVEPDVHLYMPADVADRYWRGDYNLAVGLAKREVRSKGPVNKILRLVPLTKPLFPIYERLTASKDGAATHA